MKKVFTVLLSFVLCFCFASCVTEVKPRKDQTDATQLQESKEENYALNETAVFKNLKFTATEIKESDGTDFFVPEADNVFVGIKFTIENISDQEQLVSTLLLFEGYADDVKCEYSFSAACVFDEGTLDGNISPGKKLVGWYAVEVPKGWSTIELQVKSTWLSNNPANFIFTK